MASIADLPIPAPRVQQRISVEQAWYYSIFPLEQNDGSLAFYIDQDKASSLQEELEIVFGSVKLLPVPSDVLRKAIASVYRRDQKNIGLGKKKALEVGQDSFIQDLIQEALTYRSSDIHIEPGEFSGRIRFRIDGKLITRYEIEKAHYQSLINRIKIRSNLHIEEKRLPQDGRIYSSNGTKSIDLRVSILPTLHGEKIVLRLLNRDSTFIQLESIGLTENQKEIFINEIKKPHGIILISGPTGSGKTTTLYALLKELNNNSSNILTIEDPIEYTLGGVNQVQVKETIGLTFASGLRTFMRQDPDVIMLGEIRDSETAQMAIRAALTGHLVLSTIHTNSALGTISRLMDMGVPSYLIASTLNLSVAQRLIRKLCPECKLPVTTDEVPDLLKKDLNVDIPTYKPFGCEACHFTGFNGRIAIYELLQIDEEIIKIIKDQGININPDIIKSFRPLRENAMELYHKGITSFDEIHPILLTTQNQ